MRNNQVEIVIRRYNDEVPANYGEAIQHINIYADSNNIFEALSIAYSEAINELRKYQRIPNFGCVEVCTNNKEVEQSE